nr:putative RNA-directed DNA polymerase, eukaryota, reverse transcriptase zinc-binding domain protein [Tanacetum cinerariifolium]
MDQMNLRLLLWMHFMMLLRLLLGHKQKISNLLDNNALLFVSKQFFVGFRKNEIYMAVIDVSRDELMKNRPRDKRVKISKFDIVLEDVITLEIGDHAHASSLTAQAVEHGFGEGKKVVSQATCVAYMYLFALLMKHDVVTRVKSDSLGFSYKWRLWICSCLNSAFASILVNGSLTKEFKIERGLRQGDPLSHFLFILVVESLNVALLEASNSNIFKGIKVGKDSVYVFHLQFADDALILEEYKLYGIGLSNIELNSLASTIGCLASQLPCIYLGLPIGANMSRCNHWSPLVERFHKHLSNWKSKSLSIGGRFTLIKSVLGSLGVYYFSSFKAPKKIINKLESIRRSFFWGGSMDENKISWIAWDKVLSPRNHGGLGTDSLSSCNQAMLANWWWRFRNENHALWRKVICSIHGLVGCLNDNSTIRSNSSVWYHIVRLRDDLLKVNINLPSIFKIKLGNGQTTSFLHDTWAGGSLNKNEIKEY